MRQLRPLTAAAAAGLAILLICVPFTSPRFAVREVLLRGDPRVAELVAPHMRLPAGTNLLRAPVGLLEKRAEEVPAVQRAEVSRSLPGRLVVMLERREAVAVVRGADEAMLVDPDGVVFAIRDEWGWGLPELAGLHLRRNEIGTARGKAELSSLLAVLRALGPDPRLCVARLEMSAGADPDGEAVEVMLESGARVSLGAPDRLEAKVKLLGAALDQIGPGRIETMDLSDPQAAHWRPRAGVSVVGKGGN